MFKKLIFLSFVCQSAWAVEISKPDLFLLKTYDDSKAVTGWLMSEKLDGIRGFWDGQKFLTRSGNKLNPPDWFIKNYPPFALDGELWTRQNDFKNISSIVRTKNPDKRWKLITHNIFEVPNQQGGLLERLSILDAYLQHNPVAHLKVLKQTPIKNKPQLENFLSAVISQQGEGVVVRNPDSLYATGRLDSALKVKRYFDAECTVIKILPGKGKYLNKMGSVLCQTSAGKQLKIGSGFKDKDRANPPIIGSKITFKYYGFTGKGNYKYPVYLRIRPK